MLYNKGTLPLLYHVFKTAELPTCVQRLNAHGIRALFLEVCPLRRISAQIPTAESIHLQVFFKNIITLP
jgi:spore maturation protein CgeB